MLEAYLADDATVTDWFDGAWRQPTDLLTWPRWHGDRDWLAATLGRAIARRDGPAAALRQAQRLADPDVVAVVAGQQPAVGLGPAFCLLKAAHAIALADQLTNAGQPAVPVFWCAGDDHDLDEARHVDLVAGDGRITRTSATLPHAGHDLTAQPATSGWQELVDACQTTVGAGPGQAWLEAHRPAADESLPAWFCRCFEQLFAEQGLICIEARDLRPGFVAAMAHLATNWPRTELAQRRQAVIDAGYGDPLGPLDHAPIFHHSPSGRHALAGEALAHAIEHQPLTLSPGAGLRPILQQVVLPVIAYCAGPGELRYHAQLGPIYQAAGVAMPRLIPRLSRSVISSAVGRACAAWGLTPAQLLANDPASTAAAPARSGGDRLAALASVLSDLRDEVTSLAQLGDTDQARRLESGLARLQRDYQRLADSLARGERKQRALQPLGELRAQLRPREAPQERIMSSWQLIWHYGPGLINALLATAAESEPWRHRFLTL